VFLNTHIGLHSDLKTLKSLVGDSDHAWRLEARDCFMCICFMTTGFENNLKGMNRMIRPLTASRPSMYTTRFLNIT
jgi:hypothetical protein